MLKINDCTGSWGLAWKSMSEPAISPQCLEADVSNVVLSLVAIIAMCMLDRNISQ